MFQPFGVFQPIVVRERGRQVEVACSCGVHLFPCWFVEVIRDGELALAIVGSWSLRSITSSYLGPVSAVGKEDMQ